MIFIKKSMRMITPFRKVTTFVTFCLLLKGNEKVVDVVVLLFYFHGKHLRSCRDGQLI